MSINQMVIRTAAMSFTEIDGKVNSMETFQEIFVLYNLKLYYLHRYLRWFSDIVATVTFAMVWQMEDK